MTISEQENIIPIQSRPNTWRKVPWDSKSEPKLLSTGINVDSVSPDVLELIRELDRRFIQLWDKVQYDKSN